MNGAGRRAALLLAASLLAPACGWAQPRPNIAQLRQRAEADDAEAREAQYWLCYHYWRSGAGGEGQDHSSAWTYCSKAAAHDPRAAAIVGAMYRQGQGGRRDFAKARQLLEAADAAGVGRASYELGMMYKLGQAGIVPNAGKANAYFCRAVKATLCEPLAGAECLATKAKFGSFQMGSFSQGLSAGGSPMKGHPRDGEACTQDMLSPEASGLEAAQSPAMAMPQVPSLEQFRQNAQSAAQLPAPPPVPASASASEGEVNLDKPVALQAGSAAGGPVVKTAPAPAPPPASAAPEPLARAQGPAPASTAEASEILPGARALPALFIAAGLLCGLVGLAAFLVYRSSVRAARRRLPEQIRVLLRTQPREHRRISDCYGLYCRQGGSAEEFSGEELQDIAGSLDETQARFPTPGLSCAKALDVAGRLAAQGKKARMQDVLTEPVLLEASAGGQVDDVLAVLAKVESVDDFLEHFGGPGRPAEFYSAYAAGLSRVGRVEQAYQLLTTKPMERFSPADQSLLLELHVKLGHFDQAGLLLGQVTQAKPPEAAKDFYEELARQATLRGGQRLAEDLRTIAAGKPLQGPPARPPASAGKVLAGKYELRELISAGGMGEVYEGFDKVLDRRVAIKRLLPGLLVDPLMREQFLREAKTAAHLTHPYIVPIYDSLVSGDDLYLVFEFVKGETLHSVLSRRSRLSLKECQGLFHYVCHAVDYAHRKHVLHRDLKPANIMLDENGIARVMDFGIAVEATGTLSATYVDKGGVTGTLRYMPPEQHYGKGTRASDIYALGVCLYEMATGYLPFNAAGMAELLAQKQKAQFPLPSSLVPELPAQLDALVRQALAPDPKARMQTSLEFYEGLVGIKP